MTLREIAAAFEYHTARGVGAGELGNTAAMLEALVKQYQHDPPVTLAALAALLVQTGADVESRSAEIYVSVDDSA